MESPPIRSIVPARRGLIAVLAGLLALMAFAVRVPAQCNGQTSLAAYPPSRLNIVLSDRLFVVANRSDVAASMKVWSEIAGCAMKVNAQSKVDVLASQSEMRKRILEKNVDVLVLDNVEFLKFLAAGLVEGVAVVSRNGRPQTASYVLLTAEETGSLAQLRGKNAIFFPHTESAVPVAWIDILLAKNHMGRIENFFASSRVVNRSADCILPLFFAKVDACVTDANSWELAKEMNPQMGKKLKILAQSNPVLDSVTALPKTPNPYRQKIVDGLLTMHTYAAGSQILSVFKSGPMIAYRPEYIDSTRAFWDEYVQILTPAEKAAWGDPGWNVIPKSFRLPPGMQTGPEGPH